MALVVTIVVLLILAGVSLNLVLGNSGIISQAESSKNRSEYATINDCLQLKASDYILDKMTGATTKNLIEYLQDEGIVSGDYNDIDVVALVGKELSTGKGDDKSGYYWLELDEENSAAGATYKIMYANSETYIEIGSINDTEKAKENVNWGEILANLQDAQKREEYLEQAGNLGQSISSNKDIGIGTDGNVVNLSLWPYRVINSGTGIALNEANGSGEYVVGYSNSNITDDGKIQGKVPQYIYVYSDNAIYPVTSMDHTFCNCRSLTQAPEIPSSVTSMRYAFENCRSLTQAPEIPNSVTDMEWTFNYCRSLTQAPKIPSSVTNMGFTFYYCENLIQAPEIPSSVTDMRGTFNACRSLTQAPEIPSSVTDMRGTFNACTSLTQAPEIPSSVTDMNRTFSWCESLTGTIKINANIDASDINKYNECFYNTIKPIVITGDSNALEALAGTANNNNVTIQN